MRPFHGFAALAVIALAAPTWAKDEPAETTVTCKDGSTSKGGKGACSGHGGVDKAATKAAKKESKADAGAASSTSAKEAKEARKDASKDATKEAKSAAPAASSAPAPTAGGAAATSTPARTSTQTTTTTEKRTSTSATAPANAKNTDPTGAVAKCKDGTYSHAKGHTGACSRHGGVAEWLDKK